MKTHNTQRLAGMCRRVTVWALLVSLLWTTVMPEVRAYTADGRAFLVNTEAFDTVDAGDGATNIELRFGDSTRTILYDVTLSAFVFSGNVYVRGTLSGNFLHASKTLSASGRLIVESGALIGTSGSTPVFAVDAGKSAVRVNASTPTVGKNFEVTGNSFFSVNEENDTFVIHNGPNGYDHMNVNGDIKYTLLETDRAASFGVAIGKTTAPKSDLDVVGTISGSFLAISQTASGRNLFALSSITGSHLYASSTFAGAGLSSCSNATTSKLLWNSATKTFSCGTDTDTNTQFSGTGALQTYFDNRFVNTAGDHMTGALTIRPTTGSGLHVIQPNNATGVTITTSATTNAGLNIEANSLTTGTAFRVYSNAGNFSDRHLVEIVNDNNGAQGTTALYIQQDARNPAFHVVSNTNIGDALVFEGLSLTAGNALEISVDSTMTTGRAMRVFGGPNANYDVFSVDEEGRTSIGSGSVAATTPYMLRVNGFMTGSIIHAEQDLTSSGTLRVYGSTGIGAAGFVPEATLDVLGTISGTTLTVSRNGSFSGSLNVVRGLSGSVIEAATISGTNLFATRSITGSHINAALTFAGAGLSNCGAGSTLNWLSATKQFSCNALPLGDPTGWIQSLNIVHLVTGSDQVGIGTETPDPGVKVEVIGVLSGTTLRVSAGGADIQGPLNASGSIRTDGDITLGADDAAADVTLTFMSSGTDETLTWLDSSDRFSFSNDLRVLGTISGSALIVDRYATISGSLAVKTSAAIGGPTVPGKELSVTGESYFAIGEVSDAFNVYNGSLDSTQFKIDGENNVTLIQGESGKVGIGTTGPVAMLDVAGTISGATLEIAGTASGRNLFVTRSITGSHINAALSFAGAGLTDCDNGTTSKLLWNDATKTFSCGTDQTGSGGNWSNTGSLQGYFDNRYVNTSGDTMTGTLIFNPVGTTLAINARGIISGSTLAVSGNAAFSGTVFMRSNTGIKWQGGSQLYEQTGTNRMLYYPNGDRFEVLDEAGANFIAGFHGGASSLTNSIRLYNAVGIGNVAGYAQSGTLPTNGLVVAGSTGIGTTSPKTKFDVVGTISGSYLQIAQTASGRNIFALQSITGTDLYAASRFAGAGLSDCDNATTSKLLWDAATKTFSCGTDQTGGGGSNWSNTGSLQGYFDNRYVNTSGDTMTGTLIFNPVGTNLTINARGIISGSILNISGPVNLSGTSLTALANTVRFQNRTDSTTGYQVFDADGGTSVFNIDTQNERVGIGTDSPSTPLHVVNNGNTQAYMRFTNTTNGANAIAGLQIEGQSSDWGIYSHAAARSITRYGVTVGGWSELIASNLVSSTNGILIGTGTQDKPIVFGNNDVERMRIAAGGKIGVGTTSPRTELDVVGTISGSYLQIAQTASGRNIFALQSITGTDLYAASRFAGAGLSDCDNATTSKLLWDAATKTFSCGTDQTGGSSGGLDYATASGIFVKRSGGTMTGSLTVNMSTGAFVTASGANVGTNVLAIANEGGFAYVGLTSNASTDLRIFDVRNPSIPTLVGGIELALSAQKVVVNGRYLYVGFSSSPGNDFGIYDISRPAAPVLLGGIELGGAVTSLSIDGRYAYIMVGSTLYIADISDPLLPKVVGSFVGSFQGTTHVVHDRILYTTHGANYDPLTINVSNPNVPKAIYSSLAATFAKGNDIVLSGKYGFIVGEDTDLVNGSLLSFNLGNPASPANIAQLTLTTPANTIDVIGKYAFIGTDVNGSGPELLVYDISNPAAMRYVTSVEYGVNVNVVRADGNHLYVGLASATGIDFVMLNLAGINATAGAFGSLLATKLNVFSDSWFGNDVSVMGAVSVGQGIRADGFSTFTSGSGGYSVRVVQQTSRTGALAITAHGGTTAPHITFGSGAAFDTNLFRSAANTLKTSGSFFALGRISGSSLVVDGTGSFSGSLRVVRGISGSVLEMTQTLSGRSLNISGTGAATSPLMFSSVGKGFIGFGTNSPISQLHVQGGDVSSFHIGGGTNAVALPSSYAQTNMVDGFRVESFRTAAGVKYNDIIAAEFGGFDATNFRFFTVPSGSLNAAERMTITSTGRVGIGITNAVGPDTELDVLGTISGSYLQIAQTMSGRNIFALRSITGSHLYASSTFAGAGLSDCDNATTSKLLWNDATKTFSCGTDQTGGGSSSGGGGWADDGSVVRLETIGDQVGIGTTSVDSGVKTEVVGILSGSTVKASTSLASSGVIVLRAPNTVSPTLVADGATQKVGINTASPHSSFTASGTFATSVRIATSTGSINGGDQIIFASGSSMITLTLPSASGVPGRQYTIKKTSSSINNHTRKVIINTTSSQTIDRLPQWVLTHRGQQITVVSDGSNWQIVDGSHYGLNGYRVMGTTMNQWYGMMVTSTALTTAALTTTATIRVFPFVAEKVTTINGMAVSVQTTAASAEVRLGIFGDNGSGYPNGLIVDAGTVATTTTGMRSICPSGCTTTGNNTFPVTVQPGLYWLAINNNSIAHTHRGYALAQVVSVLGHPNSFTTTRVVGWNIANSYAAFPSTFPTGASATTAIPIPAITVRIQE